MCFIVFLSGIEARGNTVLKPAEFLVETVEAGMGEVLVYVEDPEGHTEEVRKASESEFFTEVEVILCWNSCFFGFGSVRPE